MRPQPNTPEIQKLRYDRRIAKAKELLGAKCVLCANTNKLEFDHINPSTKVFVITTWIARKKWPAILIELNKCQLLCRECHIEKTLTDKGLKRAAHGSLSKYKQGCRCLDCKEANRKHHNEYMWRTGRRKRRISIVR